MSKAILPGTSFDGKADAKRFLKQVYGGPVELLKAYRYGHWGYDVKVRGEWKLFLSVDSTGKSLYV